MDEDIADLLDIDNNYEGQPSQHLQNVGHDFVERAVIVEGLVEKESVSLNLSGILPKVFECIPSLNRMLYNMFLFI